MKSKPAVVEFGKRLAMLRKSAGLTQQELGDRVGASRRMIAYYERESKYPPTHLLLPLVEALGVSTDILLGRNQAEELSKQLVTLLHKLKVVITFSPGDQETVLRLIRRIEEKNRKG